MDEELIHILLCVFSILSSTVVFVILLKLSQSIYKRKLPPGSMGFPWIGETWEFYKAQRGNRLFEEFIQPRIAKHGKVFKTHLMGSPTVIVNGANANRFVLSNEFKMVISSWPSSSVQLMGKDSIMEKQGERHRCLRGLISTTFGNAGLENLVPKICNSVLLYLDRKWNEKEEISLYRSTKTMTFTIVFECLMGINVKPGMLETFEGVLEGVFALPIQIPGSKFSRARKARSEIERMMVEVVREKRNQMESADGVGLQEREEGGMLLSRLVAGMIRGEISEEEVVDNVVLLVFAAHDTTSFAIAMTFKMLSQHSNCHALLLQEHLDLMRNKRPGESLTLDDIKKMKYTWQVARESMRLFPPIFGSFRKAIADIEYEGFTIPKGWKVLWTAYGTHYSAEYFQDPSIFNPNRFEEPVPPYVFLPFGGGPRVCAGYQLAKLTILIFVHFVVTRYDWSLLHPDEPITMDPLPFPSRGMPMKISPKI
ncbi:Cytochrome P450, E-class, group I [Parasponia andersonii]|uniref:Cytochrome P450, E-class, group I n=1 Tax=Parasponia andersonii TaxID=3476 RepID=A0A2P5D844_PARAD|nr:Cytochrome P450, E-class, group I [Parasponia andersonii]